MTFNNNMNKQYIITNKVNVQLKITFKNINKLYNTLTF